MRNQGSRFVFFLFLVAIAVGSLILLFNPGYSVETNLKMNTGYYPHITAEK